ncbi:MAG: hypothetical protein Q7R57_01210 [Dehalococcoidales bacterium]|nr:hypothetical protein [Dehalococcoidales bacterium]
MKIHKWQSRAISVTFLALILVSILLWVPSERAGAATPGPIDHYLVYSSDSRSVLTIDSPHIAGTPFNVTIQAQDASNINITSGADAQEVVIISPVKADPGLSPTSVNTVNGVALISLTLTVAQNGQALVFKGQHSGKTGTSNSFDMVQTISVKGSGTTVITDIGDSYGKTNYAWTALSDDLLGTLTIPAGTAMQQANGYRLTEIIMIESATPLTPPPNTSVIGLIYSFQPEGATFNPPVTLSLGYSLTLIPAGIAEDRLYIAQGNRTNGTWTKLAGTVDTANHTITTSQISHFSDFAIFAPTKAATFNVSNLNVTPLEVKPGEKVTVSATVTNTGDLGGSYPATLRLDGIQIASTNITMAGGASQQVSFSTSADAVGPHTVTVGGITGSFVVKALATATPTPTPTSTLTPSPSPKPSPTPTPTPTPVPSPSPTLTFTPTPSPTTPPSETGLNTWIPVGLVALVVIVGVVAWLVLRPKKR